jgi:cell division transport system ATP-binding protein
LIHFLNSPSFNLDVNRKVARVDREDRNSISQEVSTKASEEVIGVDDLHLVFEGGHVIFHGVKFILFSGEFYFLTGSRGSGKTSFLRIIYRDLLPNSGTIRVFGYDLSAIKNNDMSYFRQKIGLVFQDCRLISHLNALDNVALPLKLSGYTLKKARDYAKEVLFWIGLEDRFFSCLSQLSDDQKQRVAIARAMVARPPLFLADEPTGNIDESNSYSIILLLQRLNQMGTTVVVATHNRQFLSCFPCFEIYIHQKKIYFNRADA